MNQSVFPYKQHPDLVYAVIQSAGPGNPRNDTASVSRLGAGLIVVWHAYPNPGCKYRATTRGSSDFGRSDIASKHSRDGGRSWESGRRFGACQPGHGLARYGRFDKLKPSFFRFLNAWTLQGLWVTFTLSAALAAITATTRKELGFFGLIGLLVWVFGFAIEVVADAQKSRFRADPENKGRFIHTGLWARSRHPNYFGEIVLWIGVAIIALPILRDWQWVTLISPVLVAVLLTRISGVPMLEKRADEKWGGEEDYEAYKERTLVLIPRLVTITNRKGE